MKAKVLCFLRLESEFKGYNAYKIQFKPVQCIQTDMFHRNINGNKYVCKHFGKQLLSLVYNLN